MVINIMPDRHSQRQVAPLFPNPNPGLQPQPPTTQALVPPLVYNYNNQRAVRPDQTAWVAYRVRGTRSNNQTQTLRSCFGNEVNYCESDEALQSPEFTVDGRRSQLGFQHWSGGLKCPICLDYLQEANVLPCGHTFCKRCLWRVIRQRQEEYPHIHPRGLFFFCPSCRTKVMVRNFAKFAPPNIALNSAIDSWLTRDERMSYFREPTPTSSAPALNTSSSETAGPSNAIDQPPVTSLSTASTVLITSETESAQNLTIHSDVENTSDDGEIPSLDAVTELTSAMETTVIDDMARNSRRDFRAAFGELRRCASGRLEAEELSEDAQVLLDRIVTSSTTSVNELDFEEKLRTFDSFMQSYAAAKSQTRDKISLTLHSVFATLLCLFLSSFSAREPWTYIGVLLLTIVFTTLPNMAEAIANLTIFRRFRRRNNE